MQNVFVKVHNNLSFAKYIFLQKRSIHCDRSYLLFKYYFAIRISKKIKQNLPFLNSNIEILFFQRNFCPTSVVTI